MTGGSAWSQQAQPAICRHWRQVDPRRQPDRSAGSLRWLMATPGWPTANPINHDSDHPVTLVPAERETGRVSGATPSNLFGGRSGILSLRNTSDKLGALGYINIRLVLNCDYVRNQFGILVVLHKPFYRCSCGRRLDNTRLIK